MAFPGHPAIRDERGLQRIAVFFGAHGRLSMARLATPRPSGDANCPATRGKSAQGPQKPSQASSGGGRSAHRLACQETASSLDARPWLVLLRSARSLDALRDVALLEMYLCTSSSSPGNVIREGSFGSH